MRTPTGELLTVERWKLFIAGSLHPHGSGFLNVVALAYFLARTNLSSLLFPSVHDIFSSPMIYTYFTQTRTGAIFWHFYQSRILLGWNEQSIRNMDAMEHGYFCDWWIGRKRLCDVWYWIWWYIYMKLCFISIFIDDDQLVELEDISIEVWKI